MNLAYQHAVWSLLLTHGGVVGEETPVVRQEGTHPDDMSDEELLNAQWDVRVDYDVEPVSYYGCGPQLTNVGTVAAVQDIVDSGIDWAASSDPAQHVGRGFTGTFSSDVLQVELLLGTLTTGSGRSWTFATHVLCGFGGLVQRLAAAPPVDVALERLVDRATGSGVRFCSYVE